LTLEDVGAYMTAPVDNGHKTLPRRTPKGLLPSTWVGRAVRVEYEFAGEGRTTTGAFCDLFPVGPVLRENTGAYLKLLSWDAIGVVELVRD
jgi:hypothetical protein